MISSRYDLLSENGSSCKYRSTPSRQKSVHEQNEQIKHYVSLLKPLHFSLLLRIQKQNENVIEQTEKRKTFPPHTSILYNYINRET